MIRCNSISIDDLSSIKIIYWGNSALLIRGDYPVAIQLPNEELDWLSTDKVDELIILNKAKTEEAKTVWNILMIPNPSQYLNLGLYFVSHLGNDNILVHMGPVVPPPSSMMDELAKQFAKLIKEPPKPILPVYQMVDVDPLQEVNKPMEERELPQTPTESTATPVKEKSAGSLPHDDSDKQMDPGVVDILNINNIRKNDCLHDKDSYKYEGDVKFNPKSLKSGPRVGYIDVVRTAFRSGEDDERTYVRRHTPEQI